MMKKTLIALMLPLALTVSHQVYADDEPAPAPVTVDGGVINFTGSLVSAPCAIDNGSEAQTVELGQHRIGDFASIGDASGLRAFNITLSNCAAEVYSKASVTFSGNTASGNNNALVVNGGASGVGVQILRNGTALALDGSEASPVANLADGSNNIPFQVQYVSLSNTLTPGAANATADFRITYQ